MSAEVSTARLINKAKQRLKDAQLHRLVERYNKRFEGKCDGYGPAIQKLMNKIIFGG